MKDTNACKPFSYIALEQASADLCTTKQRGDYEQHYLPHESGLEFSKYLRLIFDFSPILSQLATAALRLMTSRKLDLNIFQNSSPVHDICNATQGRSFGMSVTKCWC